MKYVSFAGFCFAELVTWNGQSSGHLYTVTYQLVGEFVAYLLGVLNTLFAAATLAAVSKALVSDPPKALPLGFSAPSAQGIKGIN